MQRRDLNILSKPKLRIPTLLQGRKIPSIKQEDQHTVLYHDEDLFIVGDHGETIILRNKNIRTVKNLVSLDQPDDGVEDLLSRADKRGIYLRVSSPEKAQSIKIGNALLLLKST